MIQYGQKKFNPKDVDNHFCRDGTEASATILRSGAGDKIDQFDFKKSEILDKSGKVCSLFLPAISLGSVLGHISFDGFSRP